VFDWSYVVKPEFSNIVPVKGGSETGILPWMKSRGLQAVSSIGEWLPQVVDKYPNWTSHKFASILSYGLNYNKLGDLVNQNLQALYFIALDDVYVRNKHGEHNERELLKIDVPWWAGKRQYDRIAQEPNGINFGALINLNIGMNLVKKNKLPCGTKYQLHDLTKTVNNIWHCV
jgi:hypothetical protein